ncbi:hypothetical protein RvY_17441 [Ramazzottius varieornatus]|uniref:Uncharacterized protein n=1 Tax=Ramazzottius varieornatus TaxID=947166 RepID=A0A1D1W2Y9_RAMVA|nr:hypothetical protein RvY_17441 [Ramazzottius varieornatus]
MAKIGVSRIASKTYKFLKGFGGVLKGILKLPCDKDDKVKDQKKAHDEEKLVILDDLQGKKLA